MRKTILFALVATILCCVRPAVRANDEAEVRKVFDTFVEYTKTDDERTLELFAPDVAMTFYYDLGEGIREMTLPPETFRGIVKKSLAKKEGSADKYEDIQCKPDGETIKLTCTLIDGKTSVHSPLVMVFAKDDAGAFKIKAMRLKVPPPKTKPGQ